jgi:uncharacterized protein YjbJ (UPF0337 family)
MRWHASRSGPRCALGSPGAYPPERKERSGVTLEAIMSWDQIESKWDQFKDNVKTSWAKLTDDDLKFIGGQRDRLVGKLQERYGTLKEQAYKDIDAWVSKLGNKIDRAGKH